MLYPILFDPIYKEMVWGGDRLATLFDRKLPFAKTGESWDISCRAAEMGVIANGAYKGKTFAQLIAMDPVGVLGTHLAGLAHFPLLVKLISAHEDLSVQVHPDDMYARRVEGVPFGKTEAWVILDAPADAHLIFGLKEGVSRERFAQAIAAGDVAHCLEKVPAKKGDVFNIPAGLIHALTGGIVVAEVQQNADTTYRVHDYGRGRPLHIEKAMDVIDFAGRIPKAPAKGETTEKDGNIWTTYRENDMFTLVSIDVKEGLVDQTEATRFCIYTCLTGGCIVAHENGRLALQAGSSVFMPAALGEVTIQGACILLKSFVENVR